MHCFKPNFLCTVWMQGINPVDLKVLKRPFSRFLTFTKCLLGLKQNKQTNNNENSQQGQNL